MNHDAIQRHSQAYCQLFAELTPARIDEFDALVTAQVRFRDPFNDVHGRSAMKAILRGMFENTTEPHFVIHEQDIVDEHAWLRWTFSARVPVLGVLQVEGSTRLAFDADSGRISEHLDYWDSAPFYLHLPLLGGLLRLLRRRIARH
jgi:limonene-1,2-epoxide hydrolase